MGVRAASSVLGCAGLCHFTPPVWHKSGEGKDRGDPLLRRAMLRRGSRTSEHSSPNTRLLRMGIRAFIGGPGPSLRFSKKSQGAVLLLTICSSGHSQNAPPLQRRPFPHCATGSRRWRCPDTTRHGRLGHTAGCPLGVLELPLDLGLRGAALRAQRTPSLRPRSRRRPPIADTRGLQGEVLGMRNKRLCE